MRFTIRLLLGLGYFSAAWAETEILVLQSHDSQPYQQMLSGFKSRLSEFGIQADYRIQLVNNDTESGLWRESIESRPINLVLTLGTPATRSALDHIKDTPLVAGLVLDPAELLSQANATGVGLNFPANLQWQWLRRLLPDAHYVAVIYDPQHSAALYRELERLARADGINLTPATALDAEDFPTLLQNLPPQLDALWAVDASVSYNTGAIRELLLYSFRNRVPLIGLSAQWVKAGALYALDWDYTDLGRQAAELTNTILQHGSMPPSLSPIFPRIVRPILNSKTLEHMKLQISERWLAEMAEVFR